MRPGQSSNRIQEDNDILARFDQSLCLLENDIRDVDVFLRILIKGRCNDLALDAAFHVSDFLGTLIDEQNDEVHLGMILRNRVCDFLQKGQIFLAS